MIKHLLLIIISWLPSLVASQNWDSIRGGLANDFVETVLYDSIHDELLISGKNIHKVGSLQARGIARWNGVRWDSLAGGINTHTKLVDPTNPNAAIYDCVSYSGKTLVAGGFSSIGGINACGIAVWDGVKWDSLPKRAFKKATGLKGLHNKSNLTYIFGAFDTIAGQKANGFAYWDGINYYSMLLPVDASNTGGSISDMTVYQNEIYIAGGPFNSSTSNGWRDILKYDGVAWVSSTGGNGLKGGFSSVSSLTIYNNELYAAGHFLISDGNPGNNVMKWNGSQWQDVGFGNSTSFVSVYKMLVHNNKLWVFGGYNKVAGMPTYCVSSFDGTKWCILPDTVNNTVLSGAVFKDTVFIGGGFTITGGDPQISYLAKLKDENTYKNCNGVGIEEIEKNNSIKIYPNPVLNTLSFSSEQFIEKGTQIEITNALGQTVLTLPYKNEIDISGISSGCYFLKVTANTSQTYYSKFIKQ